MRLAKRILLSTSVIAIFIVYSLEQRRAETLTTPVKTASTSISTDSSETEQDDGAIQVFNGQNSQAAQTQTSSSNQSTSHFKNGTFTGSVADAFYGNIQVQAVISGGKITDVKFLQYPNDRQNSIYINSQAMPLLKQEAIQAQSARVNIVTGATDTSMAFIQSLTIALNQAGV